MKLLQSFEQGLCIIVILATQEAHVPVSAHVFQQQLGGSENYLRKVSHKLVRGKLVKSVPGLNGGFLLNTDPANITLYDVVRAMEGPVVSYPESGLIVQVFKPFKKKAKKTDSLIEIAFEQADNYWETSLKTQSIKNILLEAFDLPDLPQVNWNRSNPQLV